MSGATIAFETLAAATADRWHAAAEGAPPSAADVARIAARLAGGPLAPELRLVATDVAGPLARFAAERREKAIRLWMPAFRDRAEPAARAAAMDGFLRALLQARKDAGLEGLPLETEPGEDEPDIGPWLAALGRAGFAEACAYRLHVLARESFAADRHAIPGLAVLSIEPDALRTVAPILRQAYADTRDRRHDGTEGGDAHLARLRHTGRGYEPGLWLMAEYRGAPAATLIVNRAAEPPFPGTSAWVLEIGCLPQFRRRGFAAALMAEALARLAKTDCQRLLATIDERNAPSIRLHRRFGFREEPQRFYVYRRAA